MDHRKKELEATESIVKSRWSKVLKGHLAAMTAKGKKEYERVNGSPHTPFTLVAVHERVPGSELSGHDPHPQVFVSKYTPEEINMTKPDQGAIFETVFYGLIAGTAGRDALHLAPVFVFLFASDESINPLVKAKIENGQLQCWNGSRWAAC